MKKILHYISVAKTELHKVIFPIKEQIRNALISVVVVVSVVSLFLALVDFIMSLTVSKII
jgi:preprotein translocase subunit SecE